MLLLTGATGFLGSRLCAELLRQTEQELVCVVRASSASEAEERVRRRLARQDPEVAGSRRLRFVAGDLTRERLGLPGDVYRGLAEAVTEVHHCGASVNMAAPYAALAPVNVAGTARVLEFCRAAGDSPLHHVSTLGVFFDARRAGLDVVGEHDRPTQETCGSIGYPRSKYQAEALVDAAAAEGLPVAVYRPGLVLADSRDGACPHDDFTANLYAACALSGLFPQTHGTIPVVAADHAAQIIAALSQQDGSLGAAHPVMHQDPFPAHRFLEQARAYGYDLAPAPADQWLAGLKALGRTPQAMAIRALAISRHILGLAPDTVLPRFRNPRTVKRTADAGVPSPAMDTAYFARMFDHLIDQQVIPHPARRQP
ncbi:thioester reductase domain-containing protein [Kitasatospora misakiensis]|uniref:Thioester reductase domain-containing protein n=1 Tax=Kitasatospora misakiensis TaxID=67330 RepID=A0ABW0XBL2_9ACTN